MKDAMTETVAEWRSLLPPIFAACAGWASGERNGFDLSRPFVIGDHVYASDGRICVRMINPGGWSIPNPEKIPESAPGYFEDSRNRPEPTPIPEVGPACEGCHGSKVLPERECYACKGRGDDPSVWDCDCPHCTGRHPCERCEGAGRIAAGPCDECWGRGVADPLGYHKLIEGYWIGRGFAAILRDHRAVAYLPEILDHHNVLRFIVGVSEGVLMPMTPPGPGVE